VRTTFSWSTFCPARASRSNRSRKRGSAARWGWTTFSATRRSARVDGGVDRAHAAPAQLALDPVGAEHVGQRRGRGHGSAVEQVARRDGGRLEQPLDLRAQRGVAGARLVEVRRTRRTVAVSRLLQDRADPLIPVLVHRLRG
jgi:hypothetical protein